MFFFLSSHIKECEVAYNKWNISSDITLLDCGNSIYLPDFVWTIRLIKNGSNLSASNL